MEEETYSINKYDNIETALMKYSLEHEIPPRLLLIEYNKNNIEDSKITTLSDNIKELINDGKNLENIYEIIKNKSMYDNVLKTDIPYIYYSIVGEKAIDEIKKYYEENNILYNINDFQEDYTTWKRLLYKDVECLKVPLDEFIKFQNLLNEYEPLLTSELTITEKTIHIVPKIKYSELSFFDNIIIDNSLVYCRYNFNKINYYKVNLPADFNIEDINVKINTMEFYINIENYIYKVKYNTEKNIIKFNIPISGENSTKIVEILKTHLPIEIVNIDENLFRGNFNIYSIHLTQAIFYDFLLNNIVSNFMYINENIAIAEEKHHATINFAPLDIAKPTIKFIIYQKLTTEEITVNGIKVPSNTPFINIIVSKAKTESSIYQLKNILSNTFRIYLEDKNEIEQFYKESLPGTLAELKPIREKTSISKRKKHKVSKNLTQLAPEIFLPNYSSICNEERQPVIVSDEEAERLRNEKFTFKGTEYNRFVLEYPPKYFPKDIKRINVTCLSKDYPFVGVKRNNKLENKNIFEYVPCCFDRDQTRISGTLSTFYKAPKHEKIKTTTILKTKKLLPIEGIGTLPTDLDQFLELLSSNKFYRLGAIKDNNSLIHAVLSIIDEKYKRLPHDEKPKYAENIRSKTIKYIPAMKQELYDYSKNEIKEMILNNNIYFDPALFYRSLEEMYKINIYVFYRNKETDKVELLLPRCKYFYAKYAVEAKTVLIYESWGQESKHYEHPHCEVIAENINNEYVKIFSEKIGNTLFDAFTSIYETRTFIYNNGELNMITNAYNNNMVDILYTNDLIAVGQYIDIYGKQRALITKFKGKYITAIFPPAQPNNLPLMDIKLSKYSDVISAYGIPYACSVSFGKVDGLWYNGENIEYFLYFPIIPENKSKVKCNKFGPTNPIQINLKMFESEIYTYVNELMHSRIVFLQLITWLFTLSGNSVEDFINKYIEVGNSEYDYDFSTIEETFPDITNINDAMKYLSNTGMIKDNKIYLYTSKLLLPIKYYIMKFVKSNIIPYKIENFYTVPLNFKITKPIGIFIGKTIFNEWYQWNKEKSLNMNVIKNNLSKFNSLINAPFFYEEEDKQYIIQNVIDGNLERALAVTYAWINELKFLGYNAPQLNENITYEIYIINKKKQLEKQNNEVTSDYKILLNDKMYSGLILLQ